MSQAMGKKVTLKTLGWDKAAVLKKVLKDEKASHELAVIYGAMTKFKTSVMTDSAGEVRESTGLRGLFRGVNLDTQEKGAAAICYLPNVALDLIQGVHNDGDRIEFAVKIFAKYDEDSATSYVYEAEFLTDIIADPFAALEATLISKVPALAQLAAPAKETKKAKKDAA